MIRVMYCYPNNFTDDLIEAFASLDKACNICGDLPLHASDRLLSSMNRYDTKSEVEALLNQITAAHTVRALPSETTLLFVFREKQKPISRIALVGAQRFDNAGVLSYSQEEGIVAADLPEQIGDTQIKEERFHELMSLQAQTGRYAS